MDEDEVIVVDDPSDLIEDLKLEQFFTELNAEREKLKSFEEMKTKLKEQIQATKSSYLETQVQIERLEKELNEGEGTNRRQSRSKERSEDDDRRRLDRRRERERERREDNDRRKERERERREDNDRRKERERERKREKEVKERDRMEMERKEREREQVRNVSSSSSSSSSSSNRTERQVEQEEIWLEVSYSQKKSTETIWRTFYRFGKIVEVETNTIRRGFTACIRFKDDSRVGDVFDAVGTEIEFEDDGDVGYLSIDMRKKLKDDDVKDIQTMLEIVCFKRLATISIMRPLSEYGIVTSIRRKPLNDLTLFVGFEDEESIAKVLKAGPEGVAKTIVQMSVTWRKEGKLQKDEEMQLIVSSKQRMTKEALWCRFSRYGAIAQFHFPRSHGGRVVYIRFDDDNTVTKVLLACGSTTKIDGQVAKVNMLVTHVDIKEDNVFTFTQLGVSVDGDVTNSELKNLFFRFGEIKGGIYFAKGFNTKAYVTFLDEQSIVDVFAELGTEIRLRNGSVAKLTLHMIKRQNGKLIGALYDCLFVELSQTTTTKEIARVFGKFGTIERVDIYNQTRALISFRDQAVHREVVDMIGTQVEMDGASVRLTLESRVFYYDKPNTNDEDTQVETWKEQGQVGLEMKKATSTEENRIEETSKVQINKGKAERRKQRFGDMKAKEDEKSETGTKEGLSNREDEERQVDDKEGRGRLIIREEKERRVDDREGRGRLIIREEKGRRVDDKEGRGRLIIREEKERRRVDGRRRDAGGGRVERVERKRERSRSQSREGERERDDRRRVDDRRSRERLRDDRQYKRRREEIERAAIGRRRR